MQAPAQQVLISCALELLKPNGKILFADTQRIREIPSFGLGRRRIQQRRVNGRKFMLYKEHFTPHDWESFAVFYGLNIVECPKNTEWFSFCAVTTPN